MRLIYIYIHKQFYIIFIYNEILLKNQLLHSSIKLCFLTPFNKNNSSNMSTISIRFENTTIYTGNKFINAQCVLTYSQNDILFLKRKTGLYKTNNFLEKYTKQKIIMLSNFAKNQTNDHYKSSFKKPKLIFYKKLDRFYYRLGRKLLSKTLAFKKYTIQSFTTKKIYNLIKKPLVQQLFKTNLNNLLVCCNIFYTQNDSNNFIKKAGVLINNE